MSADRPPPVAGRILRVPGRIEVLGKHVDYAGGRSLLCATHLGFSFEVRSSGDGRVHLHDRVSGQRVSIALDPARETGRRGPVWARYPRAVVRRVLDDFFDDGGGDDGDAARLGCEIGFSSDLPSAAGLSSSSAFTTGVLLSLDAVSGFLGSEMARRAIPSLADLAGYVGAIESGRAFPGLGNDGSAGRGVGVRGGSQDHTAILCSRAGQLLQASFAPVELERRLTLPPHLVFVIGVTGVRASKASGARSRYNRLSDLAARIAELWRIHTGGSEPHLGAILASSSDAADRLRDIIARTAGGDADDAGGAGHDANADEMLRRVEQFRAETFELVPGVADALAAGDLAAVGEGVATSQRLAETHLGNQVPETMHLAASARELGAVAASAFGAGFGGAVWALVERDRVGEFVDAWRRDYQESFPGRAPRSRFVVTEAAEPARPVPARFG